MRFLNRLRAMFSALEDAHDRDDEYDVPILHWDAPPPARVKDDGLPRFSGFANELESESASASADGDARRRLARAFPSSTPIASLRQFAGRRELLASTIRAIEEQRLHVVLYGDRGIGKTSLLNVIALLAKDARYLVRYTSCSETSTFDETFRAIASDIPLLYHRNSDPTSDQVESGRTLYDLIGDRTLTPQLFSEILDGVAGTRILLVLDEFDRAGSSEFRRSVAELIKNLSDRASRAQLMIGGVAANLTELVQHIPSIRRSLLGIRVPKMSDEEMNEILAIGSATSQVPFTPEAGKRLRLAANGSPYLTNLFAHLATSHAFDERASSIGKTSVDAAVRESLASFRQRFDPPVERQFNALRDAFGADDRSRLSRHMLDNFGILTAAESDMVEARLGDRMDPSWRNSEGRFQLLDDTVPLALWLDLLVNP